MDIKIEKKEGNICVIDVTADAKKANQEYEKACKRIAQRVNIEGFRRGKAPRAILEQRIGAEAIKSDAVGVIAQEACSKAIKDNNLDVITEPVLKTVEFNLDKPSHFVMEIELRPEVTLPKYKGLTVEVEAYKTPEDAMEKQLKTICERFAKNEKTEETIVQKDSIVLIDFEGSINGEPIKGGKGTKYPLNIANSNFIPGFAEALVGKPVGEEFTIDVTFPEKYHDTTIAGKPAQFKITVHEIQKRVVPELTDELVKNINPNFKNIDDLKADIQKYLEITEKRENEQKVSEAIYNKVLEGIKVDIQETVIEREVKSLQAELEQRANAQGTTLKAIYDAEGEDKINAQLREDAITRITNSLVISKIAVEEKIRVQQKDIEEKINILARTYGTSSKEIVEQVQKNPMIINSLSQQALSEKITKFLNDNNKVVFK
ncbi:trigger factor [bacterium]|nr:trigger factor [bacterium]